ncbi:11660_t:CDS:2 [Acaulospora colombiana]|uniref:11660_t:CDS:1 n=1 Tax=Acaulospora colombiana TaxID=27376 RepID=A0ACA9N4N1_9GLOM|nr:11660_t:CDS:2 [Acaulospora colombiana]
MKEKMTSALGIVQEILLDVVRREINKDDATHHRTDVSKVGFLRARAFTSIPPHIVAKRLLDSLVLSIKTQLAIGELATASKLSEIFIHAAAPVWNGIGEWLKDGMTIGIGENMDLDDSQERSQNNELFIEKRDIEFVDPNFWEQGYTLRGEGEEDREGGDDANGGSLLIPNIFLDLSKDILGAGKAVGLLRGLGIDPFSEETEPSLHTWQWEGFERVFSSAATASSSSSITPPVATEYDPLTPDETYSMRLTIESMQTIMEDRVMRWCQAAHSALNRLLFEECSLQEHLFSLENMCFMRRGDAMTTFCDNIFMKLDAQQKWHDLHFLNGNLRSVSSVDRVPWINIELVQFHVRGGRERNDTLTLTSDFDPRKVSYPLTYLLRRPSAVVYSSVFIFLLQIRRSKALIDRILLHNREWRNGTRNEENDPNFTYALRSKFAWIIKLHNRRNYSIETEQVIGARLGPFHDQLRKAKSLDEMIALHDHHLALLQKLCFLQSKTIALHRSILAILDLALHFVNSLSVQMERDQEDPAVVPQPDDTHAKKKRKRHQRRARLARRNIVGFSDHRDAVSASSSSSDDEGQIAEDEKEVDLQDVSRYGRPSLVNSVSFAEESFVVKMDRISDELQGHVKYVKKAVDVLAGGSNEVASTFAVLSFMLEEWDM